MIVCLPWIRLAGSGAQPPRVDDGREHRFLDHERRVARWRLRGKVDYFGVGPPYGNSAATLYGFFRAPCQLNTAVKGADETVCPEGTVMRKRPSLPTS